MSKYLNILVLVFSIVACQSSLQKYVNPTLDDGKYDSEFPYKSSSAQLEEVANSVKMLNSIAFYTSYIFNKGHLFEKQQITEKNLSDYAVKTGSFTNTASGTATIIYSKEGSTLLLTCSHIINFPDTMYSFVKDSNGKNTKFVESISIKTKQTNYIPDFPMNGEIDVLLNDSRLDLAIMGRHFGREHISKFQILNYPAGQAKELEWGTFVYTMGFPMNYKMISKAIVSSPNRDNKGSFLIDAVFNKGFSGGIVLAIRDGVPNFELVGLVNSVPAINEFILVPEQSEGQQQYNPLIPYQESIYVKQFTNIRYGITKVVPIEVILSFLEEHKNYLSEKGYYNIPFLEKKSK